MHSDIHSGAYPGQSESGIQVQPQATPRLCDTQAYPTITLTVWEARLRTPCDTTTPHGWTTVSNGIIPMAAELVTGFAIATKHI